MTAARAVCCLAALLAATPGAARAEEKPETVKVEGEADRQAADQTIFSTVIRAADFETRIATVAELLEETVGLRVRSYGGLGAFATVSIRGSTAEQVSVTLDGVPLGSALGGGVNLADLPLSGVESIEVYRGFTPVHLNTAGIGGAIDIRTRKASGAPRSLVTEVSYGSYETLQGSVVASWPGGTQGPGGPGGLVCASATRSGGDFRFYDNNGTPDAAGDDGFETRENNRFWVADVMSSTGWALGGGGRAELQAAFSRRRQGVPGIDAFQSLDARAEMSRLLFKGGIAQVRAGGVTLDADASYMMTDQEFEDRLGDTTGGDSVHTRSLIDSAGPSVLMRWRPGGEGAGRHFVALMASLRLESAETTDRLNPVPDRGRAERVTYSFNIQDEIHLSGGRLVIAPSLRWSRFSSRFEAEEGVPDVAAAGDSDGQLAGSLGMAWRPSSTVTVRANAGRFYRPPSFTEIFGDQGSVKGGDDLLPEEGWNYDLGWSWESGRRGALDRLHLETTVFSSAADNLIHLVQTSQSQVTARNTGSALVRGLEISAGFGLWGWLSGSLNYTGQVAEDRSGTFRRGSDLPGRPRHELSARASASASWGRPYYEFTYLGPNFFDPAAAVLSDSGLDRDHLRVPGRYLHGAGYTTPARSGLEVTAEVDNIFNVKTVDVARYPLPGRMVQVRLRVRLP